ncbi:uncharacterized protein LOC121386319 [Gigantopelta aegis]|uniref:uncharacterized protein LOC121386319 n=1 Tax=Gigantopelta aegis TaxID=1735272 RepID=UPI001B887F6B|nr:uncharacterized protein LOC121386319 [Gigantopelta aegis]
MFDFKTSVFAVAVLLFCASLSSVTATQQVKARVRQLTSMACNIGEHDINGASWDFDPKNGHSKLIFMGDYRLGNYRYNINTRTGGYTLQIYGVLPTDEGTFTCQYEHEGTLKEAASYDLTVETS